MLGIRDVTNSGVEHLAGEVTRNGGWSAVAAILMVPGIKAALGNMNEFKNLNQTDRDAKVTAYINSPERIGQIMLVEGAHRWANSAGCPQLSERLAFNESFDQK